MLNDLLCVEVILIRRVFLMVWAALLVIGIIISLFLLTVKGHLSAGLIALIFAWAWVEALLHLKQLDA